MNNKRRYYFDLHIHSEYSYDSFIKFKKCLPYVRFQKLTGIAITDHDTFDFHENTSGENSSDIQIIKGMEVKTEYGDIIGLFINKKIASKKAIDVIREIKEQNGLAVLPHPFRDNSILKMPQQILHDIDLMELYNAHYNARKPSKKIVGYLKNIAKENNITLIAGSDAHNYHDIGRARISTADKDIKKALMYGNVQCHLVPQMLFLPIYRRLFSVFFETMKGGDFAFFAKRIRDFIERF